MSAWLTFINRKIDGAVMLDRGQCNGDYSDACVLLSALLSGIAADLWPGEDKIDRKRFVELWTRYADPKLDPALISVPLLRQKLRKSQRVQDIQAIDAARPEMFGLGHSSRLLLGTDVDMTEAALIQITTLKSNDIRPYSYPAIFYKHVRSNLAHEYKLSDEAVSHFATRRKANVSYNNRIDQSEVEMTRRLIHFHIEWVADITKSIALNVAGLIDDRQTLTRPQRWWIES